MATKKNPVLELLNQTAGSTGTTGAAAAGTGSAAGTGATTAGAGTTAGTGAAAGTAKTTQEQIAELMALMGKSQYSYDPGKDPAAQAVRKQYAREGELAARDTLAGYAGMTGGMPSTAAVSAAAQARNRYAAQSADQVVQLEQLAYGRFQDQQNQRLTQLGLLLDQEQQEYDRGRDALADQRYESELAYGREQDAYDRSWNEEQRAYERRYNEALLAAQYGDYSGLKELGIDVSAYTSGGGGSGGYGYSGSGSGGNDDGGDDELNEVYNSLLMAYQNKRVPAAVYDRLEAQYGADTLKAWGFVRLAEKNGNRGMGDANPGSGKGLSGRDLGTRD